MELHDWSAVTRSCRRESERILGSGPRAEDAAQEAVIRIWRHQAALRDPDAGEAWIARIARREALRLVAAAGGHEQELDVRLAAPSATPADLVRAADVRAALRRLAPGDRELVLARYWEDMTQAQIAARLGVPEGTVKVRLHRVRARLRDALGEH